MDKRLGDIIQSTFRLKETEGESKITTLEEAIRRNIKPKIKLHIAGSPNAALRELTRQHWGKKPHITLISNEIMTPYEISLVHCGLVSKIITTNCSYIYPAPGPIPLIQKAYKEKMVEIENWSVYSLEQRLMAGALGVGFMPTKSIVGTNMVEENKNSFKEIKDPFGSGEKVGLVKALTPDFSIIHGCAADRYGNTLLASPYYGAIWGPKASKNGAMVTVEKIVSTDFIREHSNLVKLPGYLVTSVCVAPFGSHPRGLAGLGIRGVESYGEDYDFTLNYRKISKEPNMLEIWLKKWVLDCKTQEEYLSKLGHQKVLSLKKRAERNAWEDELESLAKGFSTSEEYNQTEMMIVTAARVIIEKVTRNGYKTVLAGVGASGLPAWLGYYLLQKEDRGLDLLIGTGQVGYAPRPLDPFPGNVSNVATCKMLTDSTEIYGVIVGGENNKCLSILGAAQIDKYGNINTSKIKELYLIGVGGAGDAIHARETIVITKQAKDRFLEKVTFISCPGDRIKTLVTTLGVFEKLGNRREFVLTKYFPNPKLPTKEEKIRNIKENCGWDLKVAKFVKEVSPPTLEELMILRLLDPQRFFIRD